MEICGIYGLKCTSTGHWYIGQSRTIKKRKIHHLHKLRKCEHHNQKMQNFFDKYGESSFEFFLLEECLPEILDIREIVWIDYYNSRDRDFGFNLESGGTRGKRHSVDTIAKIAIISGSISTETRRKMSIAKKGKRHTPESKRLISEAAKLRYQNPEARKKLSDAAKRRVYTDEYKAKLKGIGKGRKLSAATRARMSKSQTGRKHSPESIEKLRLANIGKVISPEYREALRRFRKTVVISQETRDKISAANKGKKITPEHILAISLAQKARHARNRELKLNSLN